MKKDGLLITILYECLQKAREMHIETMDEFSQWLIDNEWQLNQTSELWEKENNLYHSMSELYQMFLKSKEA